MITRNTINDRMTKQGYNTADIASLKVRYWDVIQCEWVIYAEYVLDPERAGQHETKDIGRDTVTCYYVDNFDFVPVGEMTILDDLYDNIDCDFIMVYDPNYFGDDEDDNDEVDDEVDDDNEDEDDDEDDWDDDYDDCDHMRVMTREEFVDDSWNATDVEFVIYDADGDEICTLSDDSKVNIRR